MLVENDFFPVILQYPAKYGEVIDYSSFVNSLKELEIGVVVAADLLSLTLLTPPKNGELILLLELHSVSVYLWATVALMQHILLLVRSIK